MATPPDKAAETTGPPDDLAGWLARHGPALHRYFVRRAGSAQADDLVQEVFLRLQATAERAPSENVERLLFTVARRVLIDRYRTEVVRDAALHDPLDDGVIARDDISPERIVEARQDYARAIVAIAALPPRTRTAFTLHRFEKLSYSAVAKRMGISKRSVQDLMERAMSHLARDLAPRGENK